MLKVNHYLDYCRYTFLYQWIKYQIYITKFFNNEKNNSCALWRKFKSVQPF